MTAARSSSIGLLGGAFAVVLGLVVWWQRAANEPAAFSSEPSRPVVVLADEQPTQLSPATTSAALEPRRAELAGDESNTHASTRSADPRSEGDELRALVRHAGARESASKLEVHWIELASPSGKSYLAERELDVDRELALQRWGSERRTDDSGYVSVPWPIEELVLIARSGNALGTLWIEAGDAHAAHVLELVEQGEFAVRVVGAQGVARSGVRVGLGAGGTARVYEWNAASDESGLARCPNLREVAEATRSSRFAVGLAYPMRELVEVAIDPRAPPREPPVLRMPPTGSLSVQLVDEHGQPVELDGRIDLAPALYGTAQRLAHSLEDGEEATHHYPLRAGRAECAYVGLGLELVLVPRVDGREPIWPTIARGPREPGEHVRVEVEVGAPLQRLWARAIDARSKQPLAQRRLQVGNEWMQPREFATATTDEHGRFELDLPAFPDHMLVCFPVETRVILDGENGPRLAWTGPLLRSEASSDGFLGELGLGVESQLLEGRVYDPRSGLGLAHAAVVWKPAHRPDPDERAAGRAGADAIAIELFERGERVECDENGRFAVYRDSYARSFDLMAVGEARAFGTPITAPHGALGLQLTLETGAELAGSFELRASADVRQLHSVLVSEAEHGARIAVRLPVAQDGSFARGGLPAGRYALEVAPDEHAPVCLRITDIELRAGELTRDARLQRIELGQALRSVDVQVLGPSGNPIRYAEVFLVQPTGGSFVHRQRPVSFDGRASFLTAQPEVDLVVVADGLRAVHRHGVSGEVQVRLEPGLEIALTADQFAEDPTYVHAYASYQAGASEAVTSALQPCFAELPSRVTFVAGSAPGSLVLPAPGRWSIAAYVWRDSEWTPLRAPDCELGQTIDVLEADGQSFALRFDPASVAKPARAEK